MLERVSIRNILKILGAHPIGFGNSIDLTKAPFVVLKPVRTTIPTASPPLVVLWAFSNLRMRTIFVPQNMKCLPRSGGTSPPTAIIARTVTSSTGILETGTDSPVSIDSLTIASPDRRTTSAGKVCKDPSARSMRSPGTSCDESVTSPSYAKCQWSAFVVSEPRQDWQPHMRSSARSAHRM
jgi:hypothetical protein